MSTQVIERMAVEVDGQGDAIIFVHGLGGTSNVFTPQLLALGNRYRTVRQRFALSDAADAHRALEARRTTGSSILLP